MMKRITRGLLFFMAAPVVLVVVYLATALVGAVVPAGTKPFDQDSRRLEQPVYLIGTLLHTDIAIPINSLSLNTFSFMRAAGIPLDNPALKYLVIGRGGRLFYTQTPNYSDIKPITAWRSATGDDAVMHVQPTADLAKVEGIRSVQMSERGFADMLSFVRNSFGDTASEPVMMQENYGQGDVFYESPGGFNLLNPCNTWASSALREAGLGTGIWTPTSYSLELANWLHN